MTTREQWLDEGVAVLREEGEAGIRIDRLARRMGLSKGSFHHHFAGTPDYRRALLDRCRADASTTAQAMRTRLRGQPAGTAIASLPELVGGAPDVRLEAALRGWAVGDADARAAVAAIDAERLGLLFELWSQVLPDAATARAAALVPHLIAVGASVSPETNADDLRAVYALLGRLVPAVGGS